MSPDSIAERAVEELNRGLRLSLVPTRKKKELLLSVVQAASLPKEARRAVVAGFKDRTLANMVVQIVGRLPGCRDPEVLTESLATMIFDRVSDAVVRHAGESPRYQVERERNALRDALSANFELYRQDLLSVLTIALQGRRPRLAPRSRASHALNREQRIRSLLEQSLIPVAMSLGHAQAERRR